MQRIVSKYFRVFVVINDKPCHIQQGGMVEIFLNFICKTFEINLPGKVGSLWRNINVFMCDH